jgi:hypothetical protein
MHVEDIDSAVWSILARPDQGLATFLRDRAEQGVSIISARLVRKIDPGEGVQRHAAHEDDHVQMWCLAVADGARLDGLEDEAVFRIGPRPCASKPSEAGV